MPSYERRYHNLFHAYRGMASGDPVGDGPRQLEQNVTRALLITLEHAGPVSTSRFIGDLGRLPVSAETFSYDLEVAHRDPDSGAVILLGLSPDGRVAPGTVRSPDGQSRVDAVIDSPGVARVLVESKLVGGCDGDQLWRHARAWDQPEPALVNGRMRLPDNWVMRSWEDVRVWAGQERDEDHVGPVADFLLGQLADYLSLCCVAGTLERRPKTVVADEPLPPVAPGADLEIARAVSRELYGNGGTHHVTGPGCRADMARIRELCRTRGVSVPPGLASNAPGGVITPRRLLSILFGGDRYEQSALPASDAIAARKHLDRGIDRAALLAVLAWADGHSGPYRRYACRFVARAWPDAPVGGATTPELASALRARGIEW